MTCRRRRLSSPAMKQNEVAVGVWVKEEIHDRLSEEAERRNMSIPDLLREEIAKMTAEENEATAHSFKERFYDKLSGFYFAMLVAIGGVLCGIGMGAIFDWLFK